MKTLTYLLLTFFAMHSASALAESFEMNGVIQSVDLAKSIVTIEEVGYLLPNRVTDSNSSTKSPVIYQLQEGTVVRIVGTLGSPVDRIDALAILPNETGEQVRQGIRK